MFAKVYQYKFGTVAEAKVAASFCADNLGKKISKYKFQSLNVIKYSEPVFLTKNLLAQFIASIRFPKHACAATMNKFQ